MDFDFGTRGPQADRYDAGSAAASQLDIGRRLKSLRIERGWNLSEAGQATSISHSTLSKIERNELSPTLGTLQKIAQGMSIDIATLLTPAATPKGSGRRSITRKTDPMAHVTTTCRNQWIASDLMKKKMLPFHTRVTARDAAEYAEWQYHDGEIFVFVLSGSLLVFSEFYEPVTLQSGESIYYDATMGHKWISANENDAEVLWVYSE
jgi:transcriptional regulator with XRE-family HTH domain